MFNIFCFPPAVCEKKREREKKEKYWKAPEQTTLEKSALKEMKIGMVKITKLYHLFAQKIHEICRVGHNRSPKIIL